MLHEQLGHINGTEESLQDANPGSVEFPKDIPSASMAHGREPDVYPDCPRQSSAYERMVEIFPQAELCC